MKCSNLPELSQFTDYIFKPISSINIGFQKFYTLKLIHLFFMVGYTTYIKTGSVGFVQKHNTLSLIQTYRTSKSWVQTSSCMQLIMGKSSHLLLVGRRKGEEKGASSYNYVTVSRGYGEVTFQLEVLLVEHSPFYTPNSLMSCKEYFATLCITVSKF